MMHSWLRFSGWVFLAAGSVFTATADPIIWDGPTISFTMAPGHDGTLPEDQDSLTPLVAITRGYLMGPFNAVTETGYTHFSSPEGTEWAYGALADYSSLTYANWETFYNRNAQVMLDTDAVLHLTHEDIYLFVHFTGWGTPGSGFSYIRSTPAPEPSAMALGGLGMVILASVRRLRRGKNS